MQGTTAKDEINVPIALSAFRDNGTTAMDRVLDIQRVCCLFTALFTNRTTSNLVRMCGSPLLTKSLHFNQIVAQFTEV